MKATAEQECPRCPLYDYDFGRLVGEQLHRAVCETA